VTTNLLDLGGDAVVETQAITKRATELLDSIMDAFVRK
jgi:hypothetical protein